MVEKTNGPNDDRLIGLEIILKSYLNRFMVSISGINPKVGVMIHGHVPG